MKFVVSGDCKGIRVQSRVQKSIQLFAYLLCDLQQDT